MMNGTGYFRVEKTPDGRWWAIDPDGKQTIIRGVDWVVYRGHSCEADGCVCHYKEWNDSHYTSPAEWEEETLARLKKWGFNMLGTGADATLRHRGFIHAWEINFGNRFGTPDDWEDERWICPNERRPCSSLPNMFHPDFPSYCAKMAEETCGPMKDDPDLLGWFLDNELAWWGRGPQESGLFDAVDAKPETHSAKIALNAFRAEHADLTEDELKTAFLAFAAERYFTVCTEAVKAVDPNHMILGCRIAGIGGAHPVVWEVAGKYSDILTFNCYPTADLDRNVMLHGEEKLADVFRKYYEICNCPILITEWSFPAIDSGLPCTNGAGQRFLTQKERAAATELCAKTFLSLPFLVGYDYFMWVDEPYNGISAAFPENTNYGLVSEKGVPYPEITAVFEKLHNEIEKWHAAPLPEERIPDPADLSWKPPKWHGVNLMNMLRVNMPDRFPGCFDEEIFQWLEEWGFNFIRLPLDYRFLMNPEGELLEEGFEKIDEAIRFGQKHKLHIQICLHVAPGFVILPIPGEERDLNTNPESQQKFIRIWRAFAERYVGIPNEDLSFNPVNEPANFTTEQFARVFGETLIAIREIDPKRFVMLDGNAVASTPVPLFFNFKSTGQAFRGYTPHALTHYQASYIKDQPKNPPTWPCLPGPEDDPNCWIWEQPETTLEKFAWAGDFDYPIMVGEFGVQNKTSHEVSLAWMEHCLKLWHERGFSWALWQLDGANGFLDSEREDVEYEDFHGHKLDRKMLTLLKKYM